MGHIQSTGIQSVGSVASVAKAFASSVTAGNLIAVGGVSSSADLPSNAVTDTRSNSYTRTGITVGGSAKAAAYYAKNISGGSCTVTLDPTGSDFCSVAMTEFSGRDTTAPLDGSNVGDGSSTAAATANFTTAGAASDIFAVFTQGGSAATLAPGASFTQAFEDEDAGDMPIHSEYRLAVAAGTYAGLGTIGASRAWAIAAAAFKEAAAGSFLPKPPYVVNQSVKRAAYY